MVRCVMAGFSRQCVAVMLDRSLGWCERCGGERINDAHHRRPRGMGSTLRPETNQPSNGLMLGRKCHDWVESHRAESYEHGWLVHQSVDPREVPVLYRGTLVYLDDLGNMHDQPPAEQSTLERH